MLITVHYLCDVMCSHVRHGNLDHKYWQFKSV